MAHEIARVLQCVHAAADVGPSVQDGDQETEGGVGHVSRRTQHGSDTAAQQLAMEVPWIDVGNGPQCLNGKQATQRGKTDLTQFLPEVPDEFRETNAQNVASLLIDGKRRAEPR